MDGKRVRDFFSNEVKSIIELYRQFEILVPAEGRKGASHSGEDGRYIESLIRECLKKYLPAGLEVLSGFIFRPSTKTCLDNREREKECDQHSSQLYIIVYDSDHYPIYQRFDKNVIVPPQKA